MFHYNSGRHERDTYFSADFLNSTINYLPKLRTLVLSVPTEVSEDAWIKFFSHKLKPNLRNLYLKNQKIPKKALMQIWETCNELSTLELTNSESLDDEALWSIMVNCSSLESLYVWKCKGITECNIPEEILEKFDNVEI